MKIGVIQVPADGDHDSAVVARRAEELGFESYWLGDHPVVPVDDKVLDYPGRWEEGAGEPPDLVMRGAGSADLSCPGISGHHHDHARHRRTAAGRERTDPHRVADRHAR
ncbi:MAG TPA: hypothetical protein VFE65_14145 [Pseudonocardia sp.]|jgi:hypothetical protein|nr:hypothetical protein [Pseudonocardia sp.]